MERRTVLKGMAWGVPIVATAVGIPLAAASTVPVIPVSIVKLNNHGHGGNTGNTWWQVTYSDGSTKTLANGAVMSDPTLKKLAKEAQ